MIPIHYGELFNGKLHYLDPDEDFQPAWMELIDYVPIEYQSPDLDPLETPDLGKVCMEASASVQSGWGVESGWAAMATLARSLAEALGGEMLPVQLNHRAPAAVSGTARERIAEDGETMFGPPQEKEYTMIYSSRSSRSADSCWFGIL